MIWTPLMSRFAARLHHAHRHSRSRPSPPRPIWSMPRACFQEVGQAAAMRTSLVMVEACELVRRFPS